MNMRTTFSEIRNYLAGQFVGATRDESILGEVIKCLFIRSRYGPDPITSTNRLESVACAKHYRSLFKQVVKEYSDIFDDDEELLLGPDELVWTMRALEDIDPKRTSSDAIGDAYEIFIGSALRGQEGQFFTPRNAIDFLVNAVNPKPSELIVDPACGTGGFLASCILTFGTTSTHIDEFRLYGIDKDKYLVRLAKIHIALLGGDYSRILNTDSIAVHNGLNAPDSTLPGEGQYDVVLTNPPFGSKIVSARPEIAKKYDLAKKWKLDKKNGNWQKTDLLSSRVPPQVLFLEKCIRLLRPGGRCGMVVPESLLSSSQYRYVANFLLTNAKVKLVAGMPESLFKTSGKGGTHTKTCLIVFEKIKSARRRHQSIFLAEAKWCGNDSRGKKIDRDDIATILDNYKKGPRSKRKADLLGFWVKDTEIQDYSLCPRRYDPTIAASLSKLSKSHSIVLFGDLLEKGSIEICTGDEVGKLAYGEGKIPFIRTSDLSNWEIKADPKHGLNEDVYEKLKHKQDVQENDILMVKDGTYLIGTCAFVTKYDLQIVFQSHLYKIRVLEIDKDYLNPFLLLAILSCEVVQSQIRSKRVTHDIIDSLGSRIADLELPLPRSSARRREISEIVERVISDRVEARELARKARLLVLT